MGIVDKLRNLFRSSDAIAHKEVDVPSEKKSVESKITPQISEAAYIDEANPISSTCADLAPMLLAPKPPSNLIKFNDESSQEHAGNSLGRETEEQLSDTRLDLSEVPSIKNESMNPDSLLLGVIAMGEALEFVSSGKRKKEAGYVAR